MKRDLLAKSLAQMGSKPLIAAEAGSKVDESSPRSLKSMSDVLSQVSAQAAQDVDGNEIGDSEIADRFDVSEGLDDLIESIRTFRINLFFQNSIEERRFNIKNSNSQLE